MNRPSRMSLNRDRCKASLRRVSRASHALSRRPGSIGKNFRPWSNPVSDTRAAPSGADLQHDLAARVPFLAGVLGLAGALQRERQGQGWPEPALVGEPAEELEVGPLGADHEELRPR